MHVAALEPSQGGQGRGGRREKGRGGAVRERDEACFPVLQAVELLTTNDLCTWLRANRRVGRFEPLDSIDNGCQMPCRTRTYLWDPATSTEPFIFQCHPSMHETCSSSTPSSSQSTTISLAPKEACVVLPRFHRSILASHVYSPRVPTYSKTKLFY